MKAINSAFNNAENKGWKSVLDDEPSYNQLIAAWKILEGCHGIILNANDIFSYSSADSTEVVNEDIPLLIDSVVEFGLYGEIAFQCKQRGESPLHEYEVNSTYKQATKWLKDKPLYSDIEEEINNSLN